MYLYFFSPPRKMFSIVSKVFSIFILYSANYYSVRAGFPKNFGPAKWSLQKKAVAALHPE